MFARLFRTIRRFLFPPNQFDEVPKIPLETPIEDVLEVCGEPYERKPSDDFPETTVYTYLFTDRVDALLMEWRGKIHCISFWARKWEHPMKDLQYVLDAYGEGVGWDIIQAGYLYRRKDKQVYLNCSAMPFIGVETAEFADAQAAFKRTQKEKSEES